MSALARFQREFLEAIVTGTGTDRATAIYRGNVLANLHDALAAAYPVVHRLVGDAFFREAADRYAAAHPSASGDLHLYGGELAGFLARYEHARDLPYLPDVARLEWAYARAGHAADARAFDYATLAAIPEAERADLCFTLQPAACLLASGHPVVAIWEANQPDRDGSPEALGAGDRVLVYREGLAARVRRLTAEAWTFLEAVRSGKTLATMSRDEALAPVLAAELVAWTREGVIDGFVRCPPNV